MKNYQTPRGTYDILPKDISKWHQIEDVIRQFCMLYDYKEIRTPMFEDTGVFKRENDSSDMVNKEMYTFSLNEKDSLTLRPEMTAGVVRSFVQHKMYGEGDLPAKMYYIGPQFRYERPQKGRQRIFHQFGVEVIGAKNALLDVETIALGYSIVSALGMSELKVLLNTLGDNESRVRYKEALREHFAKGIDDMCVDCKRRLQQNPLRLLDCKVDKDLEIMKKAPKIQDYLNEASSEYFKSVCEGLDALGIPYEIDERLVRGLDYYTDTVFEVVSTNDQMGSQSTVFAGGRYDGLVEYFGGPEMSGIGFAMGIERLIIALEGEGIALGSEENLDAYVLCLSEKASLEALKIVTALRAAGYTCERDYLNRSFKAQFKSVERKQAKCAVILGEKDLENNTVTIKEIATQQQHVVALDKVVETFDLIFENEEECTCEGECHCGE
ncbi:histidyl-tRNA synthetase [Breznakia sp. PF5-3]|uniref:histidine--tRNA ligase n=1 Tax=unclassified Breznakia TaxID=2623764 RepID=UPI002404C5FC|nr:MULTISPECIES: histidine--tRNA ligase [unclassified Breznakia]MDF9823900.1 histidyl-tRNA synthetase [Breznakia sp. PM6-1]MDF9834699.1 histidyl-tRNA synthetase [Breznakia sp. PF5-3]MDF9836866.1 histidyl-tRNA synthetase [Breznakia sp. PFB2-8]MDF9858883.1 histidyl-tRNA synthetase [Breznakia sp. PH5-24]